MDTRECNICHLTKPTSMFHKKGAGFAYRCKECQSVYFKTYYKRHIVNERQRLSTRNKLYRIKIRQLAHESKLNKPCADCGIIYNPVCMDYDHRPGTIKCFQISCVAHNWTSIKQLHDEIAKCDIVCANCHRMRTFKRSGKIPPDAPTIIVLHSVPT